MIRLETESKQWALLSKCIHCPHHISPNSPCLISLPVLGFHVKVTEEEFSFFIFREQHFRVAVLSHFSRESLIN